MSHLEAHVRAWLSAVAELPGARIHEHGDVLWVRTGIDWPLFNGGTGGDPGAVEAALEDLQRAGRPFLWWGEPRDGAKVLRAAGLVPQDMNMRWEQCDRAALPEAELPPGVRIEEVRDEAGHRTWARTLAEAHALPPGGEQAWVQPGRLAGWTHLPWRMWTAFDDNEPVGVTLLVRGRGVASLVGAGVTEDHRRRGIGRALTLLPLAEASEDVAGLFSTTDGATLYRSLGFRPQGMLTRWLWAPPAPSTVRPGSADAVGTG